MLNHKPLHKLDISRTFSISWQIMKPKWLTYSLVAIGFCIISFVLSLIPFLGGIINLAFTLYAMKLIFNVYDKKAEDTNVTFDQFLKFFALIIIFCAAILGVFLVGAIIGGLVFGLSLMGGGMDWSSFLHSPTAPYVAFGAVILVLALTIFIMYLMVRLSMSVYLLVDKEINPIEAIKQSWKFTRGNVLNLLLLGISEMLVMLAGILCFGIGFAFALPYLYFMRADAYRQIIGGGRALHHTHNHNA